MMALLYNLKRRERLEINILAAFVLVRGEL